MPSLILRYRKQPIWTVYFAAEIAWLATGKHTMENALNRPQRLQGKETFVRETAKFWRFLNEFAYQRWGMEGHPLPDVEKHFKTALACAAARKLVVPKGGNPKTVPSPRDISQVWYVIFGENETHDAIKKRLPTVAFCCGQLALFKAPEFDRQFNLYPSLGEALAHKYGSRGPTRRSLAA